jgi:hypothetical protein
MTNPKVITEALSIYIEIVTDRARHYQYARKYKANIQTLNEAGDYELAAIYKKDYLAHRRAIGVHNMLLTDLCHEINISDLWN